MSERANQKNASSIFAGYKNDSETRKPVEFSLEEYLDLCKEDKGAYASIYRRLLTAIGEPETINTVEDKRLRSIFQNQTIQIYPAFKEIYGLEEELMKIVSFLREADQGGMQAHAILYLLGPVAGAKSTISNTLKALTEKEPMYTLAYKHPDGTLEISPVNDHPLPMLKTIFAAQGAEDKLQADYGIPSGNHYLKQIMSPWVVKRLDDGDGDLSRFRVVKRYPSTLRQIGIAVVEPQDENTQDVSALVGEMDLQKVEQFKASDVDAYDFSGALNKGNDGYMEFVEMFKAPPGTLKPLLQVTTENHYNGTKAIGAIPFYGLPVAHSNETEYADFKNNPKNEALNSRTEVINIPYPLRVTETRHILEKYLRKNDLGTAPCAPKTLDILAQFLVLTSLKDTPDGSSLFEKMEVYDGKDLRNKPGVKQLHEYRQHAGPDEGMKGIDRRAMFKTLSHTFNAEAARGGEIAADPVHLMAALREKVIDMRLPKDATDRYLGFISGILEPKYKEYLKEDIQMAYLQNSASYGQNIFERYTTYANYWLDGDSYVDPVSKTPMDKKELGEWLDKIEKPAGIGNAQDFRSEVVRYVSRMKEKTGKHPDWQSFEKFKNVIQKNVFDNFEKLLPIISFEGEKKNEDDQKEHHGYVQGMVKRGYTVPQVKYLTGYIAKGIKA